MNSLHFSIILKMMGARQMLINMSKIAQSSDNNPYKQLPYSSKVFARIARNASIEMLIVIKLNKKNRFLVLNGFIWLGWGGLMPIVRQIPRVFRNNSMAVLCLVMMTEYDEFVLSSNQTIQKRMHKQQWE